MYKDFFCKITIYKSLEHQFKILHDFKNNNMSKESNSAVLQYVVQNVLSTG